MRKSRQAGFSMLELIVAMMIIAVIATLGIRKYTQYSNQARHLKAGDTLRLVHEGLDTYHIRHGYYPDFSTFEAMVEPNSVLVKESLISANIPSIDPWKQPYEGTSSKGTYTLKCLGDPSGNSEYGPITIEPGKLTGVGMGDQGGAGKAADAPQKESK